MVARRRLLRCSWQAFRACAASGCALMAIVATARRAYGHPLHTTLTEVTIDPNGGVQVVLRAFIDDFAAAVSRRAHAPAAATRTPADTAAARYLAETLVLMDDTGQRIPLAVSGLRRTNELVWVSAGASRGSARRGVRLTNRVLFERFDDQVNIVQAVVAGRRHTLLFTRRDGPVPKPLAP